MDMNDFLELIKNPGVIVFTTGIVGAGTYLIQDWRKIAAEQRDRKMKLYEDLLESIFKLFYVTDAMDKSQLVSKIEKCWLFSSDEVLQACYEFLELYNSIAISHPDSGTALRKNEITKRKFEVNISQIFFHMRNDLRGRTTKVDSEWAKRRIVIYEWGALMNTSRDALHNNAVNTDS